MHRVRSERRTVSPDDVKMLILEAEARRRADTRSDLEKWFGDPPPDRSALAQRSTQPQPSPSLPALRTPPEMIGKSGRPKLMSRFG